MAGISLYPTASKEELQKLYVGKSLNKVPTPAAVLDISKVKANCKKMLEAVDTLDVGWRIHIKTHKTTELTKLQIGEGSNPVNIIVSTIIEAEHMVPLLLEVEAAGRSINILYGFPVTNSCIHRLAAISRTLGPSSLSLIVDHPSQLSNVSAIYHISGHPPLVFLKIDMGAHRCGVLPSSPFCTDLITSITSLSSRNECIFHGLYSHAGQSYFGTSETVALDFLRQEFEALLVTAEEVHSLSSSSSNNSSDGKRKLHLSVGATPTTTSIRNLLLPATSPILTHQEVAPTQGESEEQKAIDALRATIIAIRNSNCFIEIHAGAYCILDLQQLATHALPSSMLGWEDMALTVLAEVASLYENREEEGKTQVLVVAGTLALGRDGCKAYKGFGMITPWGREGVDMPSQEGGVEGYKGWILGDGRKLEDLSQEHGILRYMVNDREEKVPEEEKLVVGQKIRIWPNHACIAGACYSWYLVVDGDREGRENEVVDVWPRWRGW